MTEQEFHKRSIKGITWAFLAGMLSLTISITWGGAMAYNGVMNRFTNLENKVSQGNQDCKQFTKDQVSGLRNEFNGKLDTIRSSQITNSYETKLQLQGIRHHTIFVTEQHTSGGHTKKDLTLNLAK